MIQEIDDDEDIYEETKNIQILIYVQNHHIIVEFSSDSDSTLYYVVNNLFDCTRPAAFFTNPASSNLPATPETITSYFINEDNIEVHPDSNGEIDTRNTIKMFRCKVYTRQWNKHHAIINTISRFRVFLSTGETITFNEDGGAIIHKKDEDTYSLSFKLRSRAFARHEAAYRLLYSNYVNDQNIGDFHGKNIPNGSIVCNDNTYNQILQTRTDIEIGPDSRAANKRNTDFYIRAEKQKKRRYK